VNIIRLVFVDPIILLLRFLFTEFYAVTQNYGLSLILMSFSVTLLTAPLYYLAEHWRSIEARVQRKMSRELASIRAHYQGQKRFYLTRNVHRLYGYSPLLAVRASFGLLVQIPFFFAAYLYLSHYEGYAGVGFLFLKDLGKPDGLLGAVNVLPIVMTLINIASAFAYTRIFSLKGNGPLLLMSLLFLVLLYDKPAALLVYWTMNNVFSLIKNVFFPAPHEKLEEPRSSQQPGAIARALEAVRALYNGSIAEPGLIAVFALIVAGQNWWIIRYADSYKYCILATSMLAFALSISALVALLRAPRKPSMRGRIVILVLSWAVFSVSAYFLLYERRQSAYVSNLNMKMLSTVILDACAYIASMGIVERFRNAVSPARTNTGGHAVFIALVLYLFLFVFVLSPLQIYFSSPQDVGLTPWELLVRNLPALALCAGVALGLGFLSRRFGRRIPGSVFLWIIIIALTYVLMSSSRYGVLDEFSLRKAFLLEETSAWYFLLDVALVTAAAILGRYIWTKKRRLIIPALVVLTIGNTGQIVSAALKTAPENRVSTSVVASADLPAASPEVHWFSRTGKNVVFIIADMFNGNYMGRALDERPEYSDLLEGFVWYPNAVSVSSVTATSLPGILGGWDFAPRQLNKMPGTGDQKLTQAAEKFFGGVARKGYEIGAVDCVDVDLDALKGNLGEDRITTLSSSDFEGYWKARHDFHGGDLDGNPKNTLLSMLTLFRSAPFFLKARIYDKGSWILFRKSYQFQYIARKTLRNYAYLDLLPQVSGVKPSGNTFRNTFKYIHTQFTHEPFGVRADGAIISDDFPDPRSKSFVDGTSAYYTARQFLEFLSRWIGWMKREGVYDNTFIIVISDHGNNANDTGIEFPASLRNPFDRANLSPVHVLMLVKRFGAHGPVRIDPRLVSNADTPAILFSAIGGGSDSSEDPTENPNPTPRTLEYASLRGSWKDFLDNGKAGFEYYTVGGDMRDPNSWSKE
jgi:membrane protein insertase Oxa1/YidC/SpoIIIJ